MKKNPIAVINTLPFHILVVVAGVLLDQVTKLWAVSRFTTQGLMNYEVVPVIGDLLRFRLAYNTGAAFSSRPQEIAPFLSPVVFFLLLSIAATAVLIWFYRSIDRRDWLSRLGIAMVLSGALGNFIDRMARGAVIDFIDCDFPDFIMTRWPTFNVADCFVTVGVAVILLSPVLLRSIHRQIKLDRLEKAVSDAHR